MRLFICLDRGICLTDASGRSFLGDDVTDENGAFAILVDPRKVPYTLQMLLDADVDGETHYRALLASNASDSESQVDPISEAAVRLMSARGLERFDLNAISQVNSAVRNADAGLTFVGRTAAQAASDATEHAAADPAVQMALDVPALRPPLGESQGCALQPAARGKSPFWLAVAVLAGVRRLQRRRRGFKLRADS